MNYAGHLTGGLVSAGIVGATTLAVTGFHHPIVAGVCAITTLVMALYPDLDIASIPSRMSFMIGIPAIIILILLHQLPQALALLAFITVPKMFPHRGFVHTLRFGLMATLCWIFILNPIHPNLVFTLVAGIIGYLTHLLLDSHVRL